MSGYPDVPPAWTDTGVGTGPKLSQTVGDKQPDLKSTIDAMGEECRKHDAYNLQWLVTDPGLTYTPCLPFFNSLLVDIESWWAREEIQQRKDSIVESSLFARSMADRKDEFITIFKNAKKEVPEGFYSDWEVLNAVTLDGTLDRAFTGNGLWNKLDGSASSYYANDDAETNTDADKLLLVEDIRIQEFERVEVEKTIIYQKISRFLKWMDFTNTYSIEKMLETNQEFADSYNSY